MCRRLRPVGNAAGTRALDFVYVSPMSPWHPGSPQRQPSQPASTLAPAAASARVLRCRREQRRMTGVRTLVSTATQPTIDERELDRLRHPDEARAIVLAHAKPLPIERVGLAE